MNYKLFAILIVSLILISGCTQQQDGSKVSDQTSQSSIPTEHTQVQNNTLEEREKEKAEKSPESRKEFEIKQRMVQDASTFTCENLNPNVNGEINILFISQNFNNTDLLRRFASIFSGLTGDSGIITREPFKSNKNKFGFWIANKPLDFIWIEKEYGQLADFDKYSKIILASCGLKNPFYFLVENTTLVMTHNAENIRVNLDSIEIPINCTKYDFNGDGCVNIISDVEIQNRQLTPSESQEVNECNGFCVGVDPLIKLAEYLALVVNHEFGHQFGGLADEYDTSSLFQTSVTGINQSLNCFAGKLDDCLDPRKNDKWGNILGNGCGKNSVMDCKSGDADYIYEIGCFEGCNGIKSGVFRATIKSPMNNNLDTEFNLLQQRIFCNKIKNITGSVSNYCNSI